jgi:hypothetical protein
VSPVILPILVSPEAQAALKTEAAAAIGPLQMLTCAEITTPEQAAIITAVQTEAHKRLQDLETRRKAITGPLDQAKKAVDALFRPVIEPYKQLKAICAEKRNAYETALRRAEQEARTAAQALAAQGDTQAAVALVEAAKPEPSSGTSWHWTVKAVTPTRLTREWLCLDQEKVEVHLVAYKDSEAIPPMPNLEFERIARTRVRT